VSLGRFLSSLGRVLQGLGRGILCLCRLFLERGGDDTKLIRLGALLGQLLVGLLDQSLLARKRHPHIALVVDE
jgi:hypothetical protein